MSAVFEKLNLGTHTTIHVLNAPRSFEPELAGLKGVTVKRAVTGECGFAMAFVITQAQLEAASRRLAAACDGDAVLWMVYPKGTSKQYHCEFNRDSGWPILGAAGFEPVRMVAIDADWSALRFRRVEHIKTLKRTPGSTISAAGKRKATGMKAQSLLAVWLAVLPALAAAQSAPVFDPDDIATTTVSPGVLLKELTGRSAPPGARSGQASVAFFHLEPGRASAWSYNKVGEESFFVLKGHGTVWTGGKSQPVKAGSFILIPASTVRSIRASDTEALEFYAITTPAWTSEDDVHADAPAGAPK